MYDLPHTNTGSNPVLIAKNMDTNCEVIIIDEGNCFYHLKDGTIDHQYYIDENNEYATCQCGRVLWKKIVRWKKWKTMK